MMTDECVYISFALKKKHKFNVLNSSIYGHCLKTKHRIQSRANENTESHLKRFD